MLELYNSPGSTCSQKVRMCLNEKGLDFEFKYVNTQKNEHLRPEYLTLNPNGVVPTLVHDGKVVRDSSVICEYLDEVFPSPKLSPDDAHDRAQMRAWMRFFEEIPTAAIRVPSFHLALVQRYEGFSEEKFRSGEADVRPIKKHFYHRMGLDGFSKEDVSIALSQLDLTLRRMEDGLAGGSDWLMGDDFTLADIIVIPTIDRLNDLRLSWMWDDRHPNVTKWYERIRQRPAYSATYFQGTRLSDWINIRTLEREEYDLDFLELEKA